MAPRSVGTRQVPWCGHSCPHSPPFYVLHQYIDGDTPSPYKKVDFLLWPTINQPRKAIDFPSIYPKLPGFSANSRFSICPQPESVFVNAVAGRPSLSAMDRKTNNHHSPPSHHPPPRDGRCCSKLYGMWWRKSNRPLLVAFTKEPSPRGAGKPSLLGWGVLCCPPFPSLWAVGTRFDWEVKINKLKIVKNTFLLNCREKNR